MAGKRIVLFSDGTGNSSAKLFKTNVWRMYQALDLAPPDPNAPDPVAQIAYYDDGVGTSSFKPLAVLGGALGVGLARNVRDIYAFLCRHYRDGDEIYGFGFSRGAFTIRVVAGFIAQAGVITDYKSETDLRRKVAAAWRRYRNQYKPSGDSFLSFLSLGVVTTVRLLRDGLIRSVWAGSTDPEKCGIKRPKIAFLGVWDTVDAYGLPVEEMTRAWDQFIWPLSMRNYVLSGKVGRACHVLAIDDERQTFHPLLWDEREEDTTHSHAGHVDRQRISQVWFPGMHSDVGGGYPDDSLSYVSLSWMLDRIDRAAVGRLPALPHGLRFNASLTRIYRGMVDAQGPLHDSRKGFGGYYRYQPRRLDLLAVPKPVPALARLFRPLAAIIDWIDRKVRNPVPIPVPVPALSAAAALKSFTPDASRAPAKEAHTPPGPLNAALDAHTGIFRPLFHLSVFERIAERTSSYAPLILPDRYGVVQPDGSIVESSAANAEPTSQKPREERQERAFNWVWLRRVIYFLTLLATFLLVLAPLRWRVENTDGMDQSQQSGLSALPEFLGGYLPDLAKPWIAAYAAYPQRFAAYVAAIAGLLWLGGWLSGRIQDRMLAVWGSVPPGNGPGFPVGLLDNAVLRMRMSRPYRGFFRWLKRSFLPAFFFVMFAGVGMALLARAAFEFRGSDGSRCAPGPAVAFGTDDVARVTRQFETASKCWASGVQLEGGRQYEIKLTVKDTWFDAGIEADVHGFSANRHKRPRLERYRSSFFLTLGVPIRRHLFEPWFVPMARVGPTGRDVQRLVSVQPPRRDPAQRQQMTARIRAKNTGELFLYLNDAVDFLGTDLYANNRGTAEVEVKRLPW